MERKISFAVGEFYHIYNRGNNKSLIFLDNKDRERFLRILFLCNSKKPVVFRDLENKPLNEINREETLVSIGAYCLMPNHFHLLLHEKIDNGISMFMEKLATAYSMYFNKKYNRTGKLFEGRFQSEHASEDNYLQYLFAYIHLNPVKLLDMSWKEEGLKDLMVTKDFLNNYRYSSYLDFLEQERPESLILDKKPFPEYFESKFAFENFLDTWLTFHEKFQNK